MTCVKCHLTNAAQCPCGLYVRSYDRRHDVAWWLFTRAILEEKDPPDQCTALLERMPLADRAVLNEGLGGCEFSTVSTVVRDESGSRDEGFVEFDRMVSDAWGLRISAFYYQSESGEMAWDVELLGLVTPDGFVRPPTPVDIPLNEGEVDLLAHIVHKHMPSQEHPAERWGDA
jgi:hypothetical protein